MSEDQITPDMIWYTCDYCERNFTLADVNDDRCPHCGSKRWVHYTDD